MKLTHAIAPLAALAAGMLGSAAMAQSGAGASAIGVWIDHTGRGAVEIAECGTALCGHIVWLKEAKNKQVCRNQVIGNVRPISTGVWDRGWIIDPDDNARYSVELKMIGDDRLRVTGYMGSKLFSETMIWRRAPADLKRCDGKETGVQTAAAPPAVPVQDPAVVPRSETTPLPPPLPPARQPDYEIAPPEAAPTPPQRQAAGQPRVAPPAPAPVVTAPADPAPARVIAPLPAPEVAPSQRQASIDDGPQPSDSKGRRQASGKGKGSKKDCTLDIPYITIKVPCDILD